MISVMKSYPFATLVSTSEGNPLITHIPIIYNDESGKLVAHIDKYNPQVATLQDGAEVTVVFKGPDTYISPTVYTTRQLPTWNYIIVHIKGTITLINDPSDAKDTMIAMTESLSGFSYVVIGVLGVMMAGGFRIKYSPVRHADPQEAGTQWAGIVFRLPSVAQDGPGRLPRYSVDCSLICGWTFPILPTIQPAGAENRDLSSRVIGGTS